MQQRGFTMIELAIVLVIIGLLAAAFVAGKTIIRQSQVRSLITQSREYLTAVNAFDVKYKGLPGDLKRAESFWPGVTENGNGDAKIVDIDAGIDGEEIRAWQHLSLAGLIHEKMTGEPDPTPLNPSGKQTLGVNVPESRGIKETGFEMYYNADGDGIYGTRGNVMEYASDTRVDLGYLMGPALTPVEALGVDVKMDDGEPAFGMIYITNRLVGEEETYCIEPRGKGGKKIYPKDVTMLLDRDTIECGLWFWLDKKFLGVE